jgi:hypothetical protein
VRHSESEICLKGASKKLPAWNFEDEFTVIPEVVVGNSFFLREPGYPPLVASEAANGE